MLLLLLLLLLIYIPYNEIFWTIIHQLLSEEKGTGVLLVRTNAVVTKTELRPARQILSIIIHRLDE